MGSRRVTAGPPAGRWYNFPMRPFPYRWEPLVFPLLLLAAGMLLPVNALAMFEQTFLYFPEREIAVTPAAAGLPYEEVFFPAADGTPLHGWYIHGTRVDRSSCSSTATPATSPTGWRTSSPPPRTRGTGLHLRLSRLRPQRRGAGGGRDLRRRPRRPRLAAATGLEPARKTLFRAFPGSGGGGAARPGNAPGRPGAGDPLPLRRRYGPTITIPCFITLLGWALDARYDSAAKIGRLRLPLLIFQGDRDAIVPVDMARRLFARANEPKTFHLIPGAGHNDTLEYGDGDYWQAWRRFLEQMGPEQARPVDINPERPFSAISVLKKFDLSRGKTGQRKDAKLRTQAQRKSVKLFAPLRLSFPFAP